MRQTAAAASSRRSDQMHNNSGPLRHEAAGEQLCEVPGAQYHRGFEVDATEYGPRRA